MCLNIARNCQRLQAQPIRTLELGQYPSTPAHTSFSATVSEGVAEASGRYYGQLALHADNVSA
jgi:hypothetical protein